MKDNAKMVSKWAFHWVGRGSELLGSPPGVCMVEPYSFFFIIFFFFSFIYHIRSRPVHTHTLTGPVAEMEGGIENMVNLCLQPPTVNPSSLSSVGRRRRREGLLFLLSPLIFISVSVIPPASALPLRVRITRVKRSSSSCQQSHNKQGARLSSSTTRRCIMDEGNLTGDHTARDRKEDGRNRCRK